MRVESNTVRRRSRRCDYHPDQRASKAVAVSPEMMCFLIKNQIGNEATEDTLRRLFDMPPRTTIADAKAAA